MMDAKTLGQQPAYPDAYSDGLTKRQAFAMAAMQGLPHLAEEVDELEEEQLAMVFQLRAKLCRAQADALLAELAKEVA